MPPRKPGPARPQPSAAGIEPSAGFAILDRIETAVWIYSFAAGRIVWANRRGLELWDAHSVADLAARDMAAEMSVSVRERLLQHLDDFVADPGRELREFWTLYPQGKPFRVRATLRRCNLDSGGIGMLVEALAEENLEPTTIRSADALLHTEVITALFGREGRELYANPAFRAAFGPGQHRFGMDFVHAADARRFRGGLEAEGRHRATVLVRTTAGERWHDIHARRCRDAVTGDGAFLISAFDVTEAREQQQRLALALEAAEAADRAKSRFLSTMSHEVRTPLNGVLGMASILASGELTAPQRRCVEVIARSGTDMLTLMEDMLDIVTLDGGGVELVRAPFDPAALATAAIEGVRAEAERKGLTLSVDLRHLAEAAYCHDATRLRQVLRHLLNNAVKFTDTGEVVLRVTTESGARRRRGLRFEVSDTGRGVPESERERIFERFYQVDNSITRRHGGTGLGLAICREMVGLWGGRIGLSSGEHDGATFWFDAPDCVVDEPADAQASGTVVPLSRARRTGTGG